MKKHLFGNSIIENTQGDTLTIIPEYANEFNIGDCLWIFYDRVDDRKPSDVYPFLDPSTTLEQIQKFQRVDGWMVIIQKFFDGNRVWYNCYDADSSEDITDLNKAQRKIHSLHRP
jgi:hypothetical protein